jgi:hypothetical protein
MLNPFMHSKMQVKQHKIVIFPRFRSPDSGEKCQLNVECLDYATMGETWEGFRWLAQRSQYCTICGWCHQSRRSTVASTSTVQEAARQRKGESPTAVGGPKKMEHILRGGIDDANNFKGM